MGSSILLLVCLVFTTSVVCMQYANSLQNVNSDFLFIAKYCFSTNTNKDTGGIFNYTTKSLQTATASNNLFLAIYYDIEYFFFTNSLLEHPEIVSIFSNQSHFKFFLKTNSKTSNLTYTLKQKKNHQKWLMVGRLWNRSKLLWKACKGECEARS